MKSALRRRSGYTARSQSSLIDPVIAAVNARQKAKFAVSVAHSFPLEVQLRNILDGSGIVHVTGSSRGPYRAFFGELIRITNRFAGPSADLQATVVYDQYLGFGLNADLLALIARAIFSLSIEPAVAVLSLPLNGAIGVPIAGNLDWFAAARATGYDVWLYQTVNPPALVSADQPAIFYPYVALVNLTNYTWSIRSRNEGAAAAMSALWTFTTI